MTFGSLFAGIGGLDLGLERAGMTCRWQVEIDPFCRKVLAKHWPDVRRHDDVTTFPPTDPEDWSVDLICGGFPCQDISTAGKGAGIDGERSGLWSHYHRVVRLLRPRLVLVENVPAILDRGIGRVLGDMASLGFDADWTVLSSCRLGAPHTRERLFIVAHAHGQLGQAGLRVRDLRAEPEEAQIQPGGDRTSRVLRMEAAHRDGGVPDGIPDRLDRDRSLGNAVDPDVAEWIGRRILASM